MLATKATYATLGFLSAGAGIVAPTLTPGEQILLAFGLTLPLPVYVAGLAFAVAGAFIALARQVPEERAEKWWTLCAALLMGTAAAVVQKWAGAAFGSPGLSTFPPQIFMFIAGLASRRLVDWLRISDPFGALTGVISSLIKAIGGGK